MTGTQSAGVIVVLLRSAQATAPVQTFTVSPRYTSNFSSSGRFEWHSQLPVEQIGSRLSRVARFVALQVTIGQLPDAKPMV